MAAAGRDLKQCLAPRSQVRGAESKQVEVAVTSCRNEAVDGAGSAGSKKQG